MTTKTHRFTTCYRHPFTPVTGFCASCLRERLAGIDSSPSSPDLRRTKSFSDRTAGAISSAAAPEPRRRSCEVRLPQPVGSLSDLFNRDYKSKKPTNRNADIRSESAGVGIEESERGEAVRVSGDEDGEGKTMKEFIDLEFRSRKGAGRDFKDIAASFRGAASEFSKRLIKWKRKLNPKRNHRHSDVAGADFCSVEKLGFKSLQETQSEVGEYGFALGRRSCDTDPRLSVDNSRFSFEAPRASWDGYLIGKAYPRVSPMVRVGDRVLVEEEEEGDVSLENGEECCPGGSAQTKHYYSDWHRRRRSFDRSNSRRKSIMGDVDELRVISNAKVSPATTELFYGAKVLITENGLRDMNLKSSDSVMGSGSKVDACDVAIEDGQQGLNKFHKWGRLWSKLGLLQRRREDMLGEGDYGGGDVVNKPLAESWQKLRRVVNGQASESVSQKLIRSYSVSCGNPCRTSGLVNGFGGSATKGHVLNGRQKFMLQKNRSIRYSPSNVDSGLLRFYLTPLKSYRRSRSAKGSLKNSNSTARSFF
ncbi:protein OCTOPUS-like [Vigna umbellata]|uniref:protein OCTOPUS-like n=1 Tax=Vigna umbellata TaxID=87088 RepID=UPI001F5FD7E7|nr:protein OCTOPUS-like isoform X1 [Vigna umbellata]XP_047173693.1 protein OCTOPUS-like isoform X2 [Vigna umbellata]XP_047173694.1 protein OCTOPUS-like [Vigna umbellata]